MDDYFVKLNAWILPVIKDFDEVYKLNGIITAIIPKIQESVDSAEKEINQ